MAGSYGSSKQDKNNNIIPLSVTPHKGIVQKQNIIINQMPHKELHRQLNKYCSMFATVQSQFIHTPSLLRCSVNVTPNKTPGEARREVF